MEPEEQGLAFIIDGAEYPAPSLDSFDMAERRLLFELAGITQEDLVRGEDESEEDHDVRVSRALRHPGFMETLMHVAYARGNPTIKRDKVQSVIEKTNYLEAIQKWAEEDDASPPDLTSPNEPSKPSEQSNGLRSVDSGVASLPSSGEQVEIPESIGTSESATSSRAWDPVA